MNRFFLILLIMVSQRTWSQQAWSLNNCINYAIDHNHQVNHAKLEERQGEIAYQQSKWNYLPGISGGSDAKMKYGRSVDPNTNAYVDQSFFANDYYINASMEVFHGFSQHNQVLYHKFKREAAGFNTAKACDDLAFQVMNAYFDVVYFEALLEIARQQKESSMVNHQKTLSMTNLGLKSEADLLEVKANMEKDELFLLQTENKLLLARITLKKAMNYPAGEEIVLTHQIEELVEHPLGSQPADLLFEKFSRWSPEVLALEKELKAAQKNIRINQANYLPSVTLMASYCTGFYETNKDQFNQTIPFEEQLKNNRGQFLGARLSVPIFSRNELRNNVRKSKLLSDQAENRLEEMRKALLFDITYDLSELTALHKEVGQSRVQLEADRLAYQAAQKKYDKGLVGVIEFFTAKNRLANTETQYLRARLTYEVKCRVAQFYNGTRFWE